MGKKNKQANFKAESKDKNGKLKDKKKEYLLTLKTKKWIKAIATFLVAIIVTLSFFDKSGVAGKWMVFVLKGIFGDSKMTIANCPGLVHQRFHNPEIP
jgi:hypothetical protein